jgi:polysaccharide deacetylase family protein (PEP-CTERM system associated)
VKAPAPGFEIVPVRFEAPASVLTIDLEEWFCVCGEDYYGEPARWERFEPRIEGVADGILDRLASGGHRATFFVLGWVARRYPGLVRRIAAAGQEVAFHGMVHRRLDELTGPELSRELSDGKALLEDLAGRAVAGFRAPEWSVRSAADPSLRRVAEAGFLYDSSLTAVPPLGRPDNPRLPFDLRYSDGLSIREFPPLTGRAFFRPVLVGGSWAFRFLREGRYRRARDEFFAGGAPAVFTFHPWELDANHPPMEGLSPIARLVHFAGLKRLPARFDRLLSEAPMRPLEAFR